MQLDAVALYLLQTDADGDAQLAGGNNEIAEFALLDVVKRQLAAHYSFGTFLYHLNVAYPRRNGITWKMSVKDGVLRIQSHQKEKVFFVFFLLLDVEIVIS